MNRTDRLYKMAEQKAKKSWGYAWDSLGATFQRALIAEQVLAIAATQDADGVSDWTVRSIVEGGFASLPQA